MQWPVRYVKRSPAIIAGHWNKSTVHDDSKSIKGQLEFHWRSCVIVTSSFQQIAFNPRIRIAEIAPALPFTLPAVYRQAIAADSATANRGKHVFISSCVLGSRISGIRARGSDWIHRITIMGDDNSANGLHGRACTDSLRYSREGRNIFQRSLCNRVIFVES